MKQLLITSVHAAMDADDNVLVTLQAKVFEPSPPLPPPLKGNVGRDFGDNELAKFGYGLGDSYYHGYKRAPKNP